MFTNHTPEEAGNPKTDIGLLDKMGFFCDVPQTEIKAITQIEDNALDYTLAALRLSGKANGDRRDAPRNFTQKMWKQLPGYL